MKRFLAGLLFALLASPALSQGLPVCNWGDMLYRSSTGYACVPYDPTPGKFLQGNGASAAPVWTFQAPSSFLLPTQSTNTFLGNTTGGNASPTPNTVSQILDTIGYDISRPPTPGSFLYKSAVAPNNAWQALTPPATTGYALTSGGSANPPSWALNFGFVTPGVAGTCLTSNGASVTPSWQTCSGGGGGSSIVINTTTITGGTTLGLLYDNGGTVGNLSTQANSILATDAGGSPSITSTLPLAVQSAINQVGTLTSGVTGSGFNINLTLATKTGILPIANGGIGATSISGALDTAFSSAQGSILYRDFSGWQALAPGTTGQVLSTNGAAANPAWLTVTGAGTVTSVDTGAGLTGGPITSGGTISLATIATNTLLANVTGGTAVPIANTPSAVLDTIGSTRGMILYRGASGWAALGTGTSGQLLKANGAGADPSWATVASGGTVISATIAQGTGITVAGTCVITTTGTCTITNNGVTSIDSTTGAFTLGAGLTRSSNQLATTFTQTGTGAATTNLVSKAKQLGKTPNDFGASGSNQTTTGSISSGLNTLTLASAIDFVDGQYVRVNHAGAANGVNQPTGLAVAKIGTAGATSYSYRVAAFGTTGQYTAALAAVTIANGNATLSSSNYNQVTWTAPAAGTTPAGYAVFGRTGGLQVLLALVPVGTVLWNDYGDAALNAPDWIPATPPASAASSWLLTTISSGSGTTTLTLGASAGTTASTQTVVHDDTTGLQAWLTDCAANQVGCSLPGGTFVFTSALSAAGGLDTTAISNAAWSITGQSPASSVLYYKGSTVVIDLLTIGTGSTGNYFYATDFTLDSATQLGSTADQKTTGYGMRLVNQNFHIIDGVNFGRTYIAGPHSNLFHALYNDGGSYVSVRNSFQIAQNACYVARNASGIDMDKINQAECIGIGSWFGGGVGGVYMGYGNVYGPGTGVLVDNGLSATTNHQFFQSINWIIDTCGVHRPALSGNCVYLNDSNSTPSHTYVMQGWASSSQSTTGANFAINAWGSGQVTFTGAQIQASSNDGIKVVDTSTTVQIDGSTNILGNTGWGVNASSQTTKIYSDARPASNTAGAYHANTCVEGTGNPGFRKRASGYSEIWGSVAGSGSDQAVSFPTCSCPNTLQALEGNIISSGAAATQFEGLIFASQTTSGFTGKARLVSNGGTVGASSSNYNWRALCN